MTSVHKLYMKTRKLRFFQKFIGFFVNKRAMSVALSTMIITAGVIAAGIAVLYWAYGWGNVANTQYAQTVTNGQNSIEESISFEYISYSGSSLTVYVINSGMMNVTLVRLYVWDSAGVQISNASFSINQLSSLKDTAGSSPKYIMDAQIPPAHEYYEASFTVNVGSGLSGYYSFRVVTASGRNFDGSFSC